ncbi:MAG: GntR family transcriptional regulator [Pseudomonadota bacterium]
MKKHKAPLNELLVQAIRDRIISLDYAPGSLVPEPDICKEFNVSRTPIKEALKKLEDMGLVTIIPRYGTTVSSIDIADVRCAFEIKIQLEKLAGSLAARRITPDRIRELEAIVTTMKTMDSPTDYRQIIELDARFHDIIYDAAQNPILKKMLQNLHSRCARLWCSALNSNFPQTVIAGHLGEILESLKARDAARAEALMESHVQSFIDRIREELL